MKAQRFKRCRALENVMRASVTTGSAGELGKADCPRQGYISEPSELVRRSNPLPLWSTTVMIARVSRTVYSAHYWRDRDCLHYFTNDELYLTMCRAKRRPPKCDNGGASCHYEPSSAATIERLYICSSKLSKRLSSSLLVICVRVTVVQFTLVGYL
ncbi:hypothetical protein J6590_027092 [Homalodisca vitripennis]|nr:hypothetical protein J6590_027092 [Homalodisca vitripennis]